MGTIILFIAVLSVIVFVHEFGHFIAARKTGMKVYEFAIGFPPFIYGFYRDPKTNKICWVKKKKGGAGVMDAGSGEEKQYVYPNTVYSINALPLGGFCQIKGQDGNLSDEPDSFGHQKAWKRAIVVSAGVIMNIVLAAVLLGFGFMIGLPTDMSTVEDPQAIVVEEPAVVIQQVEDGSPAATAGLAFGDTILSLNGEAVEDTKELIAYIADNGAKELTIEYIREGETQTVNATPEVLGSLEAPRLGVMLVDAAVVRYPWYIAMWKGLVAAIVGLMNIFIGFFMIIKGLMSGQGMVMDVSGPVGIATMVGQSARLGIHYLINVTAMISLSLAAINILPIPALDGGHLFIIIIEGIIGKKLPQKYVQRAHLFGFILLFGLLILVSIRDVIHLF
ncbi:RIP metalloprotease RseP [Patescibacteria group bacterium]|nr:RIP metalloprotease RseP [Patescibacteria group bacterium]MBU1721508.1 RIP metalloprotease RseP [Patescibacteria group bacterium]MBU1900920.1 RIP metalloprotease RseP [Patescibacteria group bacterium]